ncbi:MAG: hypothetical protein WC055_00120 [Melioribacteraceae bacterium]
MPAIDIITICKDKEEATQACIRFLSYYPYRYAAVVELPEGEYGYTTGKTMARLNNLARQGYNVFMVKK